jgi:hypothetical protein
MLSNVDVELVLCDHPNMPPKLTDSETVAFRIPLRVIREFRILSDKTERTTAWHVRKALAQYLERENAPAASAPVPVVTAPSEVEHLKAVVAELAAELRAKLDQTTSRPDTLRLPKVKSPVKSVEPAVAVPPTSISKRSVKH